MNKIKKIPALLSLIAVSVLIYFSPARNLYTDNLGPILSMIIKIIYIPMYILWLVVWVLFSDKNDQVPDTSLLRFVTYYLIPALYFILVFAILYFIISFLIKVLFKKVK